MPTQSPARHPFASSRGALAALAQHARSFFHYVLWLLLTGLLLLTGCGSGSSADPPASVMATAGDTIVTLTWSATSGVDYWIFYSTDPSISPSNFVNLPNSHVLRDATSPIAVTGLTNGTTYYFTINGRTDNGPGGSGSPVVAATPRLAGSVWTVGPSFTTVDLHGAAFGVPGYVTVGTGGQLFTSPDTRTWTAQNSGVTADLNAIAYIGGSYDAVGSAGTTVRSTDAVTWGTTIAGTQDLYAIAQTGTAYAAVGANGAIVTSSNSTDWIVQSSGTTVNLRGIAYSGSTYVAVGDNGTILSSTDLITWTPRTSGVSVNVRSVAFGLTTFVAVGDNGTILTSPDGTTWTAATNPTTETLNAVVVGHQFVAVGVNGRILTSTDGVTWVIATSNTTSTLYSVTWSGTGYLAVGAGGTNLSSF